MINYADSLLFGPEIVYLYVKINSRGSSRVVVVIGRGGRDGPISVLLLVICNSVKMGIHLLNKWDKPK